MSVVFVLIEKQTKSVGSSTIKAAFTLADVVYDL